MTVPRETISPIPPMAKPMLMVKELRAAVRAGDKNVTRREFASGNCRLSAGVFDNLDLASGFTRVDLMPSKNSPLAEVRAACVFPSGRERNVSIYPTVLPESCFWLRVGRFGTKQQHDGVIKVEWVGVSRLQDMGDEDAINEGVNHLKQSMRRHGKPRDWFAKLWDSLYGRGAWQRNPWVWEYYFVRVSE